MDGLRGGIIFVILYFCANFVGESKDCERNGFGTRNSDEFGRCCEGAIGGCHGLFGVILRGGHCLDGS